MHDSDLNLIHFNKDNYYMLFLSWASKCGGAAVQIPLMFSYMLTQIFVEININVGGCWSVREVLEIHSTVSIIKPPWQKRTQGSWIDFSFY